MSLEELKKAILDFDENADKIADDLIKNGESAENILAAVGDILNVVGDKYERHEFYLAELMLCGDVAKNVIEKMLPIIRESDIQLKGKIIFGTVQGDIHDIGKTIIGSFLIGAGFDVKEARENKRLLGLVRDLLIMEKEP